MGPFHEKQFYARAMDKCIWERGRETEDKYMLPNMIYSESDFKKKKKKRGHFK